MGLGRDLEMLIVILALQPYGFEGFTFISLQAAVQLGKSDTYNNKNQ